MKIRSIIFTVASVLILSVVTFAAKPPVKVTKAFESKFSDAANIKWAKENAKEWEAAFTVNGVKMSANFANDGSWVETESEIVIAELPDAVASSIKSLHTGWEVSHAYKIESASKGTSYELEIKSGKKKQEVMLKEDGTNVK